MANADRRSPNAHQTAAQSAKLALIRRPVRFRSDKASPALPSDPILLRHMQAFLILQPNPLIPLKAVSFRWLRAAVRVPPCLQLRWRWRWRSGPSNDAGGAGAPSAGAHRSEAPTFHCAVTPSPRTDFELSCCCTNVLSSPSCSAQPLPTLSPGADFGEAGGTVAAAEPECQQQQPQSQQQDASAPKRRPAPRQPRVSVRYSHLQPNRCLSGMGSGSLRCT